MNEDNKIILTFDDGSTKEAEIVLTFDSEDAKNHYVGISFDDHGAEGFTVMKYVETKEGEGELIDIPEDSSEWEFIDNVLDEYFHEEKCCCHNDTCDCNDEHHCKEKEVVHEHKCCQKK